MTSIDSVSQAALAEPVQNSAAEVPAAARKRKPCARPWLGLGLAWLAGGFGTAAARANQGAMMGRGARASTWSALLDLPMLPGRARQPEFVPEMGEVTRGLLDPGSTSIPAYLTPYLKTFANELAPEHSGAPKLGLSELPELSEAIDVWKNSPQELLDHDLGDLAGDLSRFTKDLHATEEVDFAEKDIEQATEHATRQLLASASGYARSRRGYVRRETRHYELVLSRYSEHLEWLRNIPDFWRVTIYNTGLNDTPTWSDRPLNVVPLENQALGREGYAYAHHLVTRYSTLADYTVFAQAAPFEHNPYFAHMLQHPAMLNNVQAMSMKFTDTIPPKDVRDRFSPDPWFRPDKFSLRTMDSLFFEDCCIHTAALAYSRYFNVTEGSNLVNHLLTSVGLPDQVPEVSEVGMFPYGGMFGVAKRNIQQHPREVYERLVPKLLEHIQVGYLMERTWLILFGGRSFLG